MGEIEGARPELAHMLAGLMTQEEFRLVYAIQWVSSSYGAYGADGLTVDEFDQTFDHLGSALAWGIWRALEAGWRFKNIEARDDELYPRRHGGFSVEPGNSLYVHQLSTGRPINFLLLVQSAIAAVEREGINLPLEPLRHAEEEIRRMLEEVRAEMSPEDAREIFAARQRVYRVGRAIQERGAVDVRKQRTDN